MDRIRVATLQYFIRPITTFDQFRDQARSLVQAAAGYRCHLVVFPEYFTVQLLCLGDVHRPMRTQIREPARPAPELSRARAITLAKSVRRPRRSRRDPRRNALVSAPHAASACSMSSADT